MKITVIILLILIVGCARNRTKNFTDEDKFIVVSEHGVEFHDPYSFNDNKLTVFIVIQQNYDLTLGEPNRNGNNKSIIEIEVGYGDVPVPMSREYSTYMIGLSERTKEYSSFNKIVVTKHDSYYTVCGKVFHPNQKDKFISELVRICRIIDPSCDEAVGSIIWTEISKIKGWDIFENQPNQAVKPSP